MLSFPSFCLSSKFLTMDYPFPDRSLRGSRRMDFAHGACPAMVTQMPYIALHKKVKPHLSQRERRTGTHLTIWQRRCPSLTRLHARHARQRPKASCSLAPGYENGTGRMDCHEAIPPVRKSPLLAPF